MQPEIIAIGEPMVEFRACEEGTLFEVAHFIAGWGGDTSNFAVAASRSGGRVGYYTRLGDDAFAESLLALWAGEGIDATHVVRDPEAHTALYVTTHKGMEHRFSYLRRGSAASAMQSSGLPREYIQGARVLHISGISQAISHSACETVSYAVHLARQAGRTVSYDPNFRPGLWSLERARKIIHQTCREVDIFFPSLDEARLLSGIASAEEIASFYLGLGPKIVALKMGVEGALLAGDGAMRRFPAFKVPAIDASGAGDAFAGAFVAAYVAGKGLNRCMRWANAAAALTTAGLGCVRPIPRSHQIAALLTGQLPPQPNEPE